MDERSIMVLTGQAKKDYQREYMRKRSKKRRNNSGSKAQGLTQYPRVSDQEFTRLMAQAKPGNVRVSKPGDADYEPQCETTRAFVEGRPKHSYIGAVPEERGLDIKCFEDLPLDVQETIKAVSQSNEEFQRRTGIAIRYQHLFPDKY